MNKYFFSTFLLSIFLSFPQIAKPEETPKKTILLITIDSLRTDSVGVYNPKKKTSPSLDKFAKKSFQFSHAYSPSSWTKPAMASMFTSSYLSQHFAGYVAFFSMKHDYPNKDKILRYKKLLEDKSGTKFEKNKFEIFENRARKLPKSFQFLPELMQGYKRAGLTGNPNLLKQDGFDRGWEKFKYISEDPNLEEISKLGFMKNSTPKINKEVLKFLDENKSDNVFVWAHYNSIHYPYGRKGKFADEVYKKHLAYLPTGSGAERILELAEESKTDPKAKDVLVDLYEAGIKQFDQDIGELFTELEKRKISDQMFVIVSADHGEEFFEHGEFKHGNNLYNETISIPFLVKIPGQNSHVVVKDPVSLIDIAPTILDFTNSEIPKEFAGKSLMPILKGENMPQRPIISEHGFANFQDYAAVISGNLKLIVNLHTGDQKVFDLSKDPGEQKPFSGKLEKIYSNRLKKHLKAEIPELLPIGVLLYRQDLKLDYWPGQIDPEHYKKSLIRLKALGYL